MPLTPRLTPLLLVGTLTACDPLESSDLDQYKLSINLVDQLGLDSHRVLVGTDFTVSLGAAPGSELSCVETSTTGVMSKVGSATYSVDAAGSGTVEFAAPDASCPYMPDRWSAIGVEPEAATTRWIPAADSEVIAMRASPGPAGSFPEAIGRPLDRARVAADGPFVLLPTLIDQSAGERAEVRWQRDDALLRVQHEYQLSIATSEERLKGRLPVGESFTSTITILGNELELPQVESVPLDAIVDLQLVPVYLRNFEPDREWAMPLGIIALTHDSDGHRIVGAPVEWSVTRGNLHTGNPLADPYRSDVFQTWDCDDPPPEPQWRSATVEAKIAGHVAAVELEWLALPGDFDVDPGNEWCHSDIADDDRRGSGCDCSATSTPCDVAVAAWPLLALAARRRRRPS